MAAPLAMRRASVDVVPWSRRRGSVDVASRLESPELRAQSLHQSLPVPASAVRRSSADCLQTRSRRGSSDVTSRLELDLRSRILSRQSTASQGPDSPAPFPPCFTGDISENLEAHIDDKVTISCTVHGHPRPEVAWHKDGVLLLQNSHGVELWSHGFEHKLVIPYVNHEHSGVYCIVAFNQLGRSECHCVLHVVDDDYDEPAAGGAGPFDVAAAVVSDDSPAAAAVAAAHGCCAAGCQLPPELLSLFRDRFCRAGDPVLLECEISAWPTPKVIWSFNGLPIAAEDRRFHQSSQGQKHRLRLLRVTPAEAGRFCLTAENDAGVASCGALLIVEDPISGKICNQKVIRMATKLFNQRPEKPTEAWQTTPSYSLMA